MTNQIVKECEEETYPFNAYVSVSLYTELSWRSYKGLLCFWVQKKAILAGCPKKSQNKLKCVRERAQRTESKESWRTFQMGSKNHGYSPRSWWKNVQFENFKQVKPRVKWEVTNFPQLKISRQCQISQRA